MESVNGWLAGGCELAEGTGDGSTQILMAGGSCKSANAYACMYHGLGSGWRPLAVCLMQLGGKKAINSGFQSSTSLLVASYGTTL